MANSYTHEGKCTPSNLVRDWHRRFLYHSKCIEQPPQTHAMENMLRPPRSPRPCPAPLGRAAQRRAASAIQKEKMDVGGSTSPLVGSAPLCSVALHRPVHLPV